MLRKIYSFIIFILMIAYPLIAQADSTVVRIKTNLDNAKLFINEKEYQTDDYGNILKKDAWFLMKFGEGFYQLQLTHEKYPTIDTTFTLAGEEVHSLVLSFPLESDTINNIINNPRTRDFMLLSDPPGGTVTLDGATLEGVTPMTLQVNTDSFTVEVYKDGYEPLVSDLMFAEQQRLQATFILKAFQPAQLTSDSLGYTMENEIPLIDMRKAEQIENEFTGMAESFAIFPFAQGLIAKLILDKDDQKEANVLVISGAVLSGGSFLLGKILGKRKRNQIEKENEFINNQNAEIQKSNKEIEELVKEQNTARKKQWRLDNANRGVVEISPEP